MRGKFYNVGVLDVDENAERSWWRKDGSAKISMIWR